MIYLAGPYSGTEEESFNQLTQCAARMTAAGYHVFSPITMCHPMTFHAELPGDFDYWEAYDTKAIGFCRALVVLKLYGWQKSKGVNAEIAIARRLDKPVHYINDLAIEPHGYKVVPR